MGGRLPRRALSALSIAAATTLAAPLAALPARVALVHDSNPSALEQRTLTRLRGELSAAGFEVTDMPRRGADAREAAEEEPPVSGVFATIAIVPRTPDAADIWVADRITGKTVIRRVQGGAGPRGDVAAILAVRAVELLQASLLEAIEPPRRDEPTPPPAMPAAVSEWMSKRPVPEPSFSLDAGAGVLAGPGGVGPALLPILGFSYRATTQLWLRLRAGGPAFAADLEVPVGTIAVHQELVSLDLVYRPPFASGAVRPFFLAGAGAYHLDVSGTAEAPYHGRTGGLFAAHADLGAGAAVPLGSRVSIVAGARALLVAPKLVVRAAGEQVGSVGRPSVLGDLTVDVHF
jgi:hypothetical protein